MTRYPFPARRLKLAAIIRKLDAGRPLSPDERKFLAGPLMQASDANQLDRIFDLESRSRVSANTSNILLAHRFVVGDHNTKERRQAAAEKVSKKFSKEPASISRIVNRYIHEGLVPRRMETADPARVPVRRRTKKEK